MSWDRTNLPPSRTPPGPPVPPEQQHQDRPEDDFFSGLVSAVLALVVVVAVAGFSIHAAVDLFNWAWNLWGSLIS